MSLLKLTRPKLKGFLFFIAGLFLFNTIHYAINIYVVRKYGAGFYGIYASYSWIFTILSFAWIYLLICMVFSIARKKSLFNNFKPTKSKIVIFVLFLVIWLFSKVRSFLWALYVKSHPAEALQIVNGWAGIIFLAVIPLLIYLFLVYVFISTIYSKLRK